MKKTNLKKGFTLIELLVVVAIIGILASVVLASLNTARSKGSDAAIKANLDNMRAQAAIDYDTPTIGNSTNYGTAGLTTVTTNYTCTPATGTLIGDPTFCSGIATAANNSSSSAYLNVLAGTTPSWVAAANTKAVTGSWCVDSSGDSKQESVAATVAVTAATVSCP